MARALVGLQHGLRVGLFTRWTNLPPELPTKTLLRRRAQLHTFQRSRRLDLFYDRNPQRLIRPEGSEFALASQSLPPSMKRGAFQLFPFCCFPGYSQYIGFTFKPHVLFVSDTSMSSLFLQKERNAYPGMLFQ